MAQQTLSPMVEIEHDGHVYVLKSSLNLVSKSRKEAAALPAGKPSRWHRSLFGKAKGKIMVQFTAEERAGGWHKWPHDQPPEGAVEV